MTSTNGALATCRKIRTNCGTFTACRNMLQPRREMTEELVRLQTQYGDTLALRRNGRVTAANGN